MSYINKILKSRSLLKKFLESEWDNNLYQIIQMKK